MAISQPLTRNVNEKVLLREDAPFLKLGKAVVKVARSSPRWSSFIRNSAQARSRLEVLRTCQGLGAIPEALLEDFNDAYYLRNLIKCSYVTSVVLPLLPRSLLHPYFDVGAGLGTFTHAISSRLHDDSIRFVLLDRSCDQLKRADALTGALNLQGSFSFEVGEVGIASISRLREGFLLASYSLCELSAQHFASDLIPSAMGAAIVDYPEIIESIVVAAMKRERAVIHDFVELELPSSISGIIGQERIKVAYAIVLPS